MESSLKTKNLLLSAIMVALSAVTFGAFSPSIALIIFIVQIGLFSAVMAVGFKWWQIAVPAFSYGAAFLVTGDPLASVLALLYLPVSVVVAICLNKQVSRGVTVVLSSLTVGVLAFACAAAAVLVSDVNVTFVGISAFISETVDGVANSLVSGVPDSLFGNGITKEGYTRTIVELLKYFSLSFVVLTCNLVAFISTAITKRIVLYLEEDKGGLSPRIKEWLFVLSKPSAAVFVICYFCLFIGGDTLTLPQQIAFNTVMTAIQGGAFIMAFRYLRLKISIRGFSGIFMYLVVFYFFGLSAVSMILSGVGIFYAFRQKSKEDDNKCEN